MAQLGNTLINGALRVVGKIFGNVRGNIVTPFCWCTSSTAAKTVTCPGFELVDGARIVVYFTQPADSNSITLNVNGTGAKPMQFDYINSGATMEFIYSADADGYFYIGHHGWGGGIV